jgi:hypothetical protein
MQLVGEEHRDAEELRGGGEVRQDVPQEVYQGVNLCLRQRGGDALLPVVEHAVFGLQRG